MDKPTVTSFVGTFLKPEMWHVYNQVAGLTRFRSLVVTRERQNERLFPHGGVHLVHSRPQSLLQRAYLKYVKREPPIVYRGIILSLLEQLKGLQTGLLHIYFGHEATRLAPMLARAPFPVVVSFHGADLGCYVLRPEDRRWLPEVFDRCALILARCEYFTARLVELGCPRAKIRLNRTHVPSSVFAATPRDWPRDGRWNVLQACRFIPKKGLLSAIRAFAEFTREFPEASFTVAGDGPQLAELQREVRRLGLTRKVHFAGFLSRDEIRKAYEEAHFFLHPSETDSENDFEGVPNSLLEAMGTGAVVFSTAHAGIPEAVRDGAEGFLVPEKDPAALAARMLAAARDPALCQRVSEAAAARIRTEFSPERQIGILEGHYAEAMKL